MEFGIFLLLSDKSLIAYHLDVVCPAGTTAVANDTARKAPQKLSGTRDVGFFATGRMKDRVLVFYKKRDGISSTFKVGSSPLFPLFYLSCAISLSLARPHLPTLIIASSFSSSSSSSY